MRWAEITVTANTHLMAGIPASDLRAALTEGRQAARSDHGVDLGWIFDIPGERGLAAADATLDFLRAHAPEGTVALGLAGMEDGVPRAMFADHFAQARALGLKAVVHAGETTGPETVWSALRDLKADRVGHGTSACLDPALVTHLVEHAIPVEVCVSSNLRTNSVPDLASHPIRELLAAGVTVCVATDDPGMFDTDLDREYRLVTELAGLDVAGVCGLARAGVAASYAPDSLKKDMTDQIADIGSEAGT